MTSKFYIWRQLSRSSVHRKFINQKFLSLSYFDSLIRREVCNIVGAGTILHGESGTAKGKEKWSCDWAKATIELCGGANHWEVSEQAALWAGGKKMWWSRGEFWRRVNEWGSEEKNWKKNMTKNNKATFSSAARSHPLIVMCIIFDRMACCCYLVRRLKAQRRGSYGTEAARWSWLNGGATKAGSREATEACRKC